MSPDFSALVQRFDAPDVLAIALMGSYARGDAGPLSDIDLVRFGRASAQPLTGDGSYLVDGRLVVVSTVYPPDIARWFDRPEAAVKVIAGLRTARPLLDRAGVLDPIQQRACAFTWDAAMQTKADAWASQELVGWIEEVHKGLAGLRHNHIGRLLNARFGLSWGLNHILCVYKGVLLAGDNDFYDGVAAAPGVTNEWVQLRDHAFGIAAAGEPAFSLAQQVVAGLRLYVVTAEMLAGVLRAEDTPLVAETVKLIRETLAGIG